MSRLDRLLGLLESGATEAVRRAAAAQIGDVQQTRPGELHSLLDKVLQRLLSSRVWETRTAAALAVDAILAHVPPWRPAAASSSAAAATKAPAAGKTLQRLREFDFEAALRAEAALVGSGGREYAVDAPLPLEPQKARLRARLRETLGEFVDVEELVQEDDLLAASSSSSLSSAAAAAAASLKRARTEPQQQQQQQLRAKVPRTGAGDSVRMEAAAKLHARRASAAPTPVLSCLPAVTPPAATRLVATEQPQDDAKVVVETQKDGDAIATDGTWPLGRFADVLCDALTSPQWEARHGAAMGLRSLLSGHASDAGRAEGMSAEAQERANAEWLEDVAVHLLCVLCRDRFNDFVSDQTVAPVRETCAQALGLLAKAAPPEIVDQLISAMLVLHGRTEDWEVRLSGLLGIKYIVAVRVDLAEDLLPRVLGAVMNGLTDLDDDNRGASASVLLPVSKQLVENKKIAPWELDALGEALWETLMELDDITASTAPVMELLADLHSLAGPACKFFHTVPIGKLIPRLLPYLHHAISAVRIAAHRTLARLLGTSSAIAQLGDVLNDVIAHLFFVQVADKVAEQQALGAWSALFKSPEIVLPACFSRLPVFINCLRTPSLIQQRGRPVFGKMSAAELSAVAIDDPAVSRMLADSQSSDCAEAVFSGCRALGVVGSAFSKEQLSDLFALLECLLDYDSLITALLASLILDFSVSPSETPAVRLSPRISAQLARMLSKDTPIPAGETDIRARVAGCCASAIVQWGVPQKLNDILHSLLSSIKTIGEPFSSRSASAMAKLMLATSIRQNSPNPKLVSILSGLLVPKSSSSSSDGSPHPADHSKEGAEKCVRALASLAGPQLFEKVPSLWAVLEGAFSEHSSTSLPETRLAEALAMFAALIPAADSALLPKFLQLLPTVVKLVAHQSPLVQTHAIAATTTMCNRSCARAMTAIIEHMLPLLRPVAASHEKMGAARAVQQIVAALDIKIVPFCAFFIGPLLSCMSDQDKGVRECVAFSFGSLVRLLPLEAASHDSSSGALEGMPADLLERRDTERRFLQQLLDGRRLDYFKLPFAIHGVLRKYQQEGINWLAFLRKYHLHGILCDDMGLGKTLQAMCAVAAAALDEKDEAAQTRPSLVVCPPTLVGHWASEISRFVDEQHLKPVVYGETRAARQATLKALGPRQLLIASYDQMRRDHQAFRGVEFNYCVLDEGHVIKNAKTKLSQAVKTIRASNRLILTGTPVQNNVLELWSLFDFLIPGFLGTEREFNERFSKPIAQSRSDKATAKDQEAGAHAMEALHKQVQPLLLRRMKEDVLQDLPPKIIQDFVVALSPLQQRLYEDFAEQRDRILPALSDDAAPAEQQASSSSDVLQALHYLRKVCAHPALVLSDAHPMHGSVMRSLAEERSDLHDFKHSAKLVALRDILRQCGIGVSGHTADSHAELASQHRVLVFAQLKTVLDVVEEDLFKKHMPDVTYMRLDGSVPASKRQDVVTRFNGDPTIDVLLLTTHVGGLGLSLTGADVVIFLEHDWNPTKDLQAMDRAHRIGQAKVVNVYRVITRGTIEEKIMGLQRFKTHLANTVVSRESDSSLLSTVDTANLLDLFSISSTQQPAQAASASASAAAAAEDATKGVGEKVSAVLREMGELWDDAQYAEEFDVSGFVKRMAK